jgi:hypothetical protein
VGKALGRPRQGVADSPDALKMLILIIIFQPRFLAARPVL